MAKYSLTLFWFFLLLNGFNSIQGLDDSIHTIQLSTLFPSITCNSSPKGDEKKVSTKLKIVHKHGPCFQPNKNKPNHVQILRLDQRRVESIQSKYSKSLHDVAQQTDSANLPAKDGSIVGSGNYIVTVGLGTPKRDLSLIFDTGSDLTWTQCEPCVKSCYKQKETIFDPKLSKTYSNISCSSDACNSLGSATGNAPGCSASTSTCIYGIQYGDSSFSVGYFGKETLTLTPTDIFPNFYFGCGQNNQGLFGGAAGLIGLGRDKLSLISQTAAKYKNLFSYCLPSSSSTTGHLTFGGSIPKPTQFTPLSSSSRSSSFYGLDVVGIVVGGKKLSIPSTVFSSSGTIIDSGTVITRLQPTAYTALKTSFRDFMSRYNYPSAPALSILDTCYDFSKYTTISIPKIVILFRGGSQLSVDKTGVFYVNDPSQVCLAFAPNGDDSDLGILGNTQQKTLEVVYDVGGGRLGFASGGCQ